MKSVNPANMSVLAEFDALAPNELEALVSSSQSCFAEWAKKSFTDRARFFMNAAEVLRNRSEDWATLITLEMGKPLREAKAEVEKCAWVCEYYAKNAATFLADEIIESDASKSYVSYEPLGVVLAVMPWNFPFWQVFRFAAPTLMAGNVGLLKHAENVPRCALAIEEIFLEAGFPTGVFHTLLVGHEAVAGLLADPRVRAVSLTGSERAGRSVGALAGQHLKPALLELGGSDPFIVLKDANLDDAIAGAVTSRMLNGGQSCIAAKRFIIENEVYEAFCDRLERALKALTLGDPMNNGTDVGPLARPDLVDTIHEQVIATTAIGGSLILGGKKSERGPCFYPVTLVADVRPGMRLFDEETFGPVAAVIRASDVEHAIELANESTLGLGSSLWTAREDVEELAAQIQAGHVAINGIVKSDPRLPFGGIKDSGFGRELGPHGPRSFVNTKTVWIK
jgi:succinate-semialdehyde dehydrogenase/glutarate-semialdehyde dehydrogenase